MSNIAELPHADDPPVSQPTAAQAIAAVQAAVPTVGKDRKPGDGPKYNYRGIDDVINALHPLLAEHGVTIASHVVEHERSEFTHYSKPHTITTLIVDFWVYGPAGDHLPHPVRAVGYGVDNSDKGPGKALSYAYKSAIGQLFSLPTDDPAMDVEHSAAATVTPKDAADIWLSFYLLSDDDQLRISEALNAEVTSELIGSMPADDAARLRGWIVKAAQLSADTEPF